MRKFLMTCCSTVDLPKEYLDSRNIPYICFHYTLDDVQYADDLGESMSHDEFYKRLAAGSTASTSQVNSQEYKDFFEPLLQQGHDILHISLSSGISGSYGSAVAAVNELAEKYPQRKIQVVDSLGASSGYGLLVSMVADLRDSNTELEDAAKWLMDNRLYMHHWFFSSDLTFYIRGGRIPKTAGFFGKVLGICPLMNMNDTGHLIPREKIRTKKRVITEIAERMNQHAAGGADYNGKCFMCHSDSLEDAKEVARLVEAAFPKLDGPVMINTIGTVVGSHTGPGTVALFFMGDHRKP